ncbi:MAG: hypothetical protein V3T58_07495 [Candidatus Hydrothermarchaeales archaeon]
MKLKCPLCGYEFAEEMEEVKCKGCPMSRGCGMICCPHCNYQFVQKSKTIDVIKKILRRRR